MPQCFEVPLLLKNMLDDLLSFTPLSSTPVIDELQLYLSTDPENVQDAIQWWYEKWKTFSCLYRMALNYLSIPGVYP